MNRQEKLEVLTDWQNSYNKVDIAFDNMSVLMGCSICDSDMFDSTFKMFDRYTTAVAMLLNGESNNLKSIEDWLSWYCYECNMGKKPMEAKASVWKRAKKIKTLQNLLDIIEAE